MKNLQNKTRPFCQLTLAILLLFYNSTITNAQDLNATNIDRYYEYESMTDAYIHVPESEKVRGPAYAFSSGLFTITQVNVDSIGNNIIGDAANEPSLAIDPTNPDRMAIGWRQFGTIQSNFRQAGIGYSNDGGLSWESREPIEADLFRSDPVLDTDSEGNFYYHSLRQNYECDVFRTDDPSYWEDKTYAVGGDKQWMVIDKTGLNSNGHIYAFWKQQFSSCTNGSFNRSTDNGMTFEDCTVVPDNPTRGTLAIGPDGELYACGGWGISFKVLKSSTAKDPTAAVDWEANVTVDLKGELALYAGPNPSGMLGQVWVATDNSDGPNRGNVYLLSSVRRYDNNDPADMMFSRSTDGGLTWSEAIQINNDDNSSNWQWFGSMSVAPNGRIDVTWLDTRDNPGTVLSSLYYSSSFDGGLTWTENDKLSDAFDPHLGWPNQNKIGDYNHMISDDEGAHLAWAATFNGEQDVYYSFIEAEENPLSNIIDLSSSSTKELTLSVYPNPVEAETTLSFFNHSNQRITLTLHNILGRPLGVLADKHFPKGQSELLWTPKSLTPGVYYLKAENDSGESSSAKFIVIK